MTLYYNTFLLVLNTAVLDRTAFDTPERVQLTLLVLGNIRV